MFCMYVCVRVCVSQVDPGSVLPLIRTLLASLSVTDLPVVFKVKAMGTYTVHDTHTHTHVWTHACQCH